jgi:hypothetical protein
MLKIMHTQQENLNFAEEGLLMKIKGVRTKQTYEQRGENAKVLRFKLV